MQRKTALRYLSEFQVVYDAVSRHFHGKGVKLPPDWEDLVTCACFPDSVGELTEWFGHKSERNSKGEWVVKLDAKTGEPVKAFSRVTIHDKQILALRENFARDPDLTLKILCFARQTLARLTNPTNDADKVRIFLLKYNTLVRENGVLRLSRMSDAESKKRIKLVRVDGSGVQDGELAALIFGSTCEVKKVEIVKKVRQSLSYKVKKIKGRTVVLLPDFPKGEI